jgi:hypothetical protein
MEGDGGRWRREELWSGGFSLREDCGNMGLYLVCHVLDIGGS